MTNSAATFVFLSMAALIVIFAFSIRHLENEVADLQTTADLLRATIPISSGYCRTVPRNGTLASNTQWTCVP